MSLNKSSDEPFILAGDAIQTFYVDEIDQSGWQVAIATKPRDLSVMQSENVHDHMPLECDHPRSIGGIFLQWQSNEGLGFNTTRCWRWWSINIRVWGCSEREGNNVHDLCMIKRWGITFTFANYIPKYQVFT